MSRTNIVVVALISALATVGILIGTAQPGARAHSAVAPERDNGADARANRRHAQQRAMRATYESRLQSARVAVPRAAAPTPSCEEGLLPWRRGRGVNLCVAPCASDADCASFERCRVLSADAKPTDPPRFADEQPPERGEPVQGLCDPFYEIDGALSATLATPSPFRAEERASSSADAGL